MRIDQFGSSPLTGGSPLLSLVILMTQFAVFVTEVLSEGDEPMCRKFHVSLGLQGECAM